MNSNDWNDLIRDKIAATRVSILAHTYRKRFATYSQPVLLVCGDTNQEYVVKGRQIGRAIINDHIVGKLGMVLGAAVGNVILINVTDELIKAEPEMAHMSGGVAHGSLWIADCSDREWKKHENLAENRERFALLAILYGWFVANDRQLIYRNSAPQLVHSVDHGHFLPGGPNWTCDSLKTASNATGDTTFITSFNLTADELKTACRNLSQIDDICIADAVAAPPDDWKISIDERVCLAEYLSRRRDELMLNYSV